ncbi:ROK family protein [Yoonia sp.]|uniref:ROK family protein n=1 Tax=Yoonia sp. TaxID=2212373 RepID=UPI0019E65E05|nr:ROK family protein [Yoonia sp.]MBE0412234.1 ROK family protein [Yoonia sp.]
MVLGIDLGGTKIAAQIFNDHWQIQHSKRIATPRHYRGLTAALTDLVRWAETATGAVLPVGIGSAGLINPADGLALAANLPIAGNPFPAHISEAVGRPVTCLNDSRALTLSEAVLGAGQGCRTVLGLVLGTGVGGGIAIDGRLLEGPSQTGGEFGHVSASAALVAQYGLPLVPCGCGRTGCVETLISGAGLSRIGAVTMGQVLDAPAIAARRGVDPAAQAAWDIWCALVADLVRGLILTVDPDCIVLGGGLSQILGIATDLRAAVTTAQFSGFPVPPIYLAQGGDISGARGAAYAAVMAQR